MAPLGTIDQVGKSIRLRRKSHVMPPIRPMLRAFVYAVTLSVTVPAVTLVAVDCNRNGVDDAEDLASRFSRDCDSDAVPDECELAPLRFGIYGEGPGVVERVQASTASDLNADGYDDALLASVAPGGASQLLVLGGSSTGDFLSPTSYSAGEDVTEVVGVDVDADGDIDVLVTNAGALLLFTNDGSGTLEPPSPIPLGGDGELLSTEDMDGDGHMDLVTVTTPERQVEILAGVGDGSFRTKGVFAVGVRPEDLATADFDGNGTVDAAVLTRSAATISFLANDGNGELSTPEVLDVSGRSPFALAARDLNGDEHVDLAVAQLRGVNILLGLGEGAFTETATHQIPPSILEAADLTGDGVTDLAVGSSSSSLVTVLVNDGVGRFGPSAVNSSTRVTWRPGTIATGDFNGDGDPDLAVTDRTSDGMNVVWNNEDNLAIVGFTKSLPTIPIGFKPHGAVSGDFNGDGTPDVATSNGHDRGVSFLFGNGNGSFVPPTVEDGTTYLFAGAGHLNHMTAGDYDGDGDLDAAAADREQNRIGILLNHGDGTFAKEVHYPAGARAYHVQSADLDGDGTLDLAVANAAANTASLLFNAGDGSFPTEQVLSAESQPESVALADLDGDGEIDVLVANRVSFSLSFFFREPDGSYRTVPSLPTLGEAISLTTGDFDRDGDQDVVSINNDDAEYFENPGNGAVERGGLFPHNSSQSPFSVTSDDVNSDGLPDILSANFFSGTISILLSLGDNTFQPPFLLSGGEIVRAAVTGDFDHDGDIDILGTNRLDNNATVYLNALQQPDVPNPLPPRDCESALNFRRGDGNGDGTTDLSDTMYVLEYLFQNGPPAPCAKSADVDDSGGLDIVDPIYLVEHLFRDGPAPAEPFESCGEDATEDPLSCQAPTGCD